MNVYNLVFSNLPGVRFRRHLFFWIAWCLYWLTTYLIPTQWIPAWNFSGPLPQINHYGFMVSFLRIMMNTILMTIIYMALTYGILYLILPRYFSKTKSRLATTLLLLFYISIVAFINYLFFLLVFAISTRLGYFNKMPDMNFILPVWLRQTLFNYPTVVGFALSIKLLKNYYLKQQEAAQVSREMLHAELLLLKAQVHPHFLFNTLNNIYSFIINDSSAAPAALTKLSTLLRYIIYECNQPLVKLEKELTMIHDYIELEKIRYGENFNMSFQVQGTAGNKMICPLLLVPLLENSFKHGASQMLVHSWIHLDILITESNLHFNLSNSKPASINEKIVSQGLGLKNVKKRLDILYHGRFKLDITDDLESFIVSCKVPLFELDEKTEEIFIEKKDYELA
jgi:sensor histidine kinase YesM